MAELVPFAAMGDNLPIWTMASLYPVVLLAGLLYTCSYKVDKATQTEPELEEDDTYECFDYMDVFAADMEEDAAEPPAVTVAPAPPPPPPPVTPRKPIVIPHRLRLRAAILSVMSHDTRLRTKDIRALLPPPQKLYTKSEINKELYMMRNVGKVVLFQPEEGAAAPTWSLPC